MTCEGLADGLGELLGVWLARGDAGADPDELAPCAAALVVLELGERVADGLAEAWGVADGFERSRSAARTAAVWAASCASNFSRARMQSPSARLLATIPSWTFA